MNVEKVLKVYTLLHKIYLNGTDMILSISQQIFMNCTKHFYNQRNKQQRLKIY